MAAIDYNARRKVAKAMLWTGAWEAAVDYELHDVATDSGLYICTLAHSSHAGVDGNFVSDSGAPWVGAQASNGRPVSWSEAPWSAAVAYQAGQVVIYQGNHVVALQAGTNHVPPSGGPATAYWDYVGNNGGVGEGAWDVLTAYVAGQAAKDAGAWWFCVAASTGNQPSLDNGSHWVALPGADTDRGEWTAGASYRVNDLVLTPTYNNQLWICTTAHVAAPDTPSNQPSVEGGAHWSRIADAPH